MITNFSHVAHFYATSNVKVKTIFLEDGFNNDDYKHLDFELLELLNDGTNVIVKPYLKSLNDLTKTEIKELQEMIGISNLFISFDGIFSLSGEKMLYLTSRGYDVFNLIENGLAFKVN